MKISTHSIARAGFCLLTASAVVFAQSVQPAPPPEPAPTPTVRLAAIVQPTALTPQTPVLTILLNSPLALLGPAAPLGTGLPPAPAPLAIPIAPNLADSIDSIYIEVEKWVQYGFEVATSVVRWIPYAGWFAGLIMDGYFFGESLVASAVFNTTDWLRGDGGFVDNLADFGVDVGLAFVWLGLDALATFVPLPPCNCYPPRPPVQGPFLASTALVGPTETAELTMARSLEESTPLVSSEPETVDKVESLSEDVTEEQVTAVVTPEVTGTEVVTPEVTGTEVITPEVTGTEVVTPEVTDTKVTDTKVTDTDTKTTDTTTTDTLGNIEAQGKIRGPNVDASIDKDAKGNAEDGAKGANGAGGVGGAGAEVKTAKDTDGPTDTTHATTADSDSGDGHNASGTE